jgi:imidazolonepropionase-like amidohydrolase
MARFTLPLLLALAACGGTERPKTSTTTATEVPTSIEGGAPKTVERVVVTLGRTSGKSVITTNPDGSRTTLLHVLENGRGPHVDATFRLASDGTIASFEATGNHTFGTKIDETFALEGGKATWAGAEENGSREVSGAAFFVPIAGVPEMDGLLVQAALANGGAIALLPDGEARVTKGPTMKVTGKDGEREIVEHTITGLSLTPYHTWMNTDGTWWGSVSDWQSVVPAGFEGAIEALQQKQRELDRAADADLAAKMAHRPPAAGLAYTHARVLDVEKGKWIADQTVVVVGDTITAVGPAKKVKVPAGAEVVDLGGRALIPGMFDMHAHFGPGDGVLNIASGVTTARDVGNDPDALDDYKARFDQGTAIGPHIVRFGFIEGRNEKAASSKVTAETVDEAKAAVKFYVDRGYEGVKIYNSVKPELVPVIAEAAHAAGKRVTGHIPVHMLAHEAVKAGYDGIEHINMLFLNFFATHDTDTRDTTRFTLVGDKAKDFDLGGKEVKAFIALLKKQQTVIDPTVNAFEWLLVSEQGKVIPGLEPTVARLPLQVQRGFVTGALPLGEKQELYRASFGKLLEMIQRLHAAKVPLVLGTDALAGLMYHHEMRLFARAGLENADILRIATIGAARTLGMDKQVGSIAKGKRADLVVIDGDPLKTIDDIGRVVSTMRAGVVYDATALYQAVGVKPL